MGGRARRGACTGAIALSALGVILGLRRLEVAGDSMVPTLEAGDHLVAVRTARPRPGDLVVVADPRRPGLEMVKRVHWTGRDGRGRRAVWVEGDNREASTDSRALGLLPERRVRARVVWRYAPSWRAGRLGRSSRGGAAEEDSEEDSEEE